MPSQRTLLFLTQVFPPDPASVGQHMADAAREMASRGYRVVVLTARRGYEDPSARYPARERLDGVEVVRVPLASFGKASSASKNFLRQWHQHPASRRLPPRKSAS